MVFMRTVRNILVSKWPWLAIESPLVRTDQLRRPIAPATDSFSRALSDEPGRCKAGILSANER
jgi:hypothetical protein